MDSGLSGFDAPGFSSQALAPSQANQQAVQVMQKKKSGIGSWLPTIGSIALPVGAALLAPETGGASLLALAALSGAGSVAGKVGENAIDHNSLASGTGGEFLSGAAGGLLGGVGGKVAGKALKVAANYGDNLLTQTGGTVARNTARALDAKGTTQIMSGYGINPADHATIAGQITGQDGILNKLVNKAVGQAGPVDTTGVDKMASDLIGQDTRIGDTASQKALTFIQNGLSKVNNVENTTTKPLTKAGAAGTNDILNSGAHPNDTLDFIRSLQSKAAELTGNGKNALSLTDESKGVAAVYKQVASELEDRLYSGAGADKAVVNGLIGPDEVKQLMDVAPGNKKWGSFVQKVMGAQTVGDLRSLQAPFVKAAQLAREKGINAATKGATGNWVKAGIGAGGLAAAPFTGGASLAVPAAEAILGTDTGKTLLGNGLRGFADKFSSMAGSKAGQVAGATVPQMITHAPDFTDPNSALPLPDTSPFAHPDNQSVFSQLTANNSALINQTPDSTGPGISGYTDDELQTGIANAIGAGDIKAATEIQNLLKLNQSNKTGANAPLGQVQKRQLAQINTAVDRLQRVAQDYEGFNIGNGPLGKAGGMLKTIEGKVGLNNNVGAYNDQLSDVAMEIARALGGGTGNVSDVRVSQIEKALPKVTDSHAQAVKKINNLLNDLLSAQKEFVSVPSSGGDNVANPNDYTGSPQGFTSNPAQVQFAQ